MGKTDEILPPESYVLEVTFPPHQGDLLSQIREMDHYEEQFCRFYWILLGNYIRNAPGNASETVGGHNCGGGVSTVTDNRCSACGLEIVTPTLTFWLPEFLKRRDIKPSGDSFGVELMQILQTPFKEVMKFGDMATDVAKTFATIDIDHVEYLLKNPEDLRSSLQGIAKGLGMNQETLREVLNLPDLAHSPSFFDDMHPQNFNDD